MTMTSETSHLVFATTVGVGSLAMSAHSARPCSDPSALVCDHEPNGRSITVDFIYLRKSGYVLVHRSDAQGKPMGVPIGTIRVAAGGHRYVDVTLSEQPEAGEKLWVSLYKASDARRRFAPDEREARFRSAEWSL